MIGKEILERKPVSLSHIRDFLENRDMGGKEPSYEQTQTLDYVVKFAKLPKDKAESLFNNLLNIENMSEDVAVKIVDFLPEDEESIKILLPKGNELTDAQIGEVLALVKKHSGS
ncbi:MAG: RNA polymerase Rpb4 family protein [Candidatus Diapherotrites archaeon]